MDHNATKIFIKIDFLDYTETNLTTVSAYYIFVMENVICPDDRCGLDPACDMVWEKGKYILFVFLVIVQTCGRLMVE